MTGRTELLAALAALIVFIMTATTQASMIRGVAATHRTRTSSAGADDDSRDRPHRRLLRVMNAADRSLCVEYDCDLYVYENARKKKKSKQNDSVLTSTEPPPVLPTPTEPAEQLETASEGESPEEEDVESTIEFEEPTTQEPATDAQETEVDQQDPAFKTQGSVTEEDGLVSTCLVGPLEAGPAPVVTVVPFTYQAAVVKQANAQQILQAVEKASHQLLTNALLSCSFDNIQKSQSEIQYTSISTLPKDLPVSATSRTEVCQNIAGDYDCYQVTGGVTVSHLPHEPTSEVRGQVGAILKDAMSSMTTAHSDLARLVFLSNNDDAAPLDSESDVETETADRDPAVTSTAVLGSDEQPGVLSRPFRAAVAGGTAAAAIVVLLGLAAGAILVRGRRRTRSNVTTVQPMDDDKNSASLLDDSSTDSSTSSIGLTANVIYEEGTNSDEKTASYSPDMVMNWLNLHEGEIPHDSAVCGSNSCPVCQAHPHSQTPVFVGSSSSPCQLMNESMKDLRPQRLCESSERAYSVDNTVDL